MRGSGSDGEGESEPDRAGPSPSPSPSPSRWHRAISLELAVFAIAAAAYAVVAAPGVVWMDAGELTAAAFTLGGGHPPGEPLHSLLGKAATLLPVGEIAFRLNLLSAVAMAAALAGVVALGRELVPRSGPALAAATVGAALVAVSPAALVNASRAEVYAGSAALLVWTATFALRARTHGRGRDVLLASLLAALASGFHPLTAIAVALPLAIALAVDLGRRALGLAGPAIAVAAVALAAYAYLPARAGAAAPPLLAWGDPSSWSGLRDVVAGGAYRENFALDGAAGRGAAALALLLEGPGLGLVLAGAVGLLLAALTRLRGAAMIVAVAATIVVEVAAQRAFNPDLRGYLLPVLLVVGAGLAPLVEAVRRLSGELGRRPPVAAALTAVVLAPIGLAALAAPPAPALDRGDDPTRLFAATVALAPPGPGVYFATGDHTLFAAYYERLVAGARPDLALAHPELARDRWFLEMVKRMRPELEVPYLDDGVRGQLAERLAIQNLRRGLVVAADQPTFGRLEPSHAAAVGRGFVLALAPRDAGPGERAAAPLDFTGEVGARVARAVGLTRATYEADRGRLADAARAAGLAARFGDAGVAALSIAPADPARPSLLASVPRRTFAFVSEPWLVELLGDDLAWRAGQPAAPLARDAPAERVIHAIWRELLERGPAGLDDAAARLREVDGDAEVATSAMLTRRAPDLAEAWLAGVLERHPDDAGAAALLASLLGNRGDLGQAEALFRRAIAIDPAVAETWARFGVVLARRGKRAEAEGAWRRALDLDPGRGDVRAWLGTP